MLREGDKKTGIPLAQFLPEGLPKRLLKLLGEATIELLEHCGPPQPRDKHGKGLLDEKRGPVTTTSLQFIFLTLCTAQLLNLMFGCEPTHVMIQNRPRVPSAELVWDGKFFSSNNRNALQVDAALYQTDQTRSQASR